MLGGETDTLIEALELRFGEKGREQKPREFKKFFS